MTKSKAKILDRYESFRQKCLQMADLHPDSPKSCNEALSYAKGCENSNLLFKAALLVDDMGLFIEQDAPAKVIGAEFPKVLMQVPLTPEFEMILRGVAAAIACRFPNGLVVTEE